MDPLSKLAPALKLHWVDAQSKVKSGCGAGLPRLPTPAKTAKCGVNTAASPPAATPSGLKTFRKSPPTRRPEGPDSRPHTPGPESRFGSQGFSVPVEASSDHSLFRRVALGLASFSPLPPAASSKSGFTVPSSRNRGSVKTKLPWPPA